MAFYPYLQTQKRGCYKAPLKYTADELTPECRPDLYTSYFRQRWKTLMHDPCKAKHLKAFCPLGSVTKDLCLPPASDPRNTTYNSHFIYPWSHNNVDDCCKAPCPCDDEECNKEPKIDYVCKLTLPSEPLDDMTTHRQHFTPKPVPPPPQRRIGKWDPCGCPLESATSNRIDYPHKKRIPNGPVMAEVIKHGMWSMDQFSEEPFPEETEVNTQFTPKCGGRRFSLKHRNNLGPGEGPMESTSETCYQYPEKRVPDPEIPGWLHGDIWVKHDTPLDSCTTYKHFYRRHPFPYKLPTDSKIESPDAIPFSTMHNVWYTCCDPKVDQRTPVELKDNDPWPYVVECPIRYQDNLQTDPCAPFRDETTQKADYTPKTRCRRPQNFAPSKGFTPPIQPMIDDTSNRVSFRAYTREEYKGAKTSSGNPNGKRWGPFKCPPNIDKCLPRFPAPYGHPLKPYTGECACGPFDDRSSYYQDYKFRTEEMVEYEKEQERRRLEAAKLPKGVSIYSHDFVNQQGTKAARMPPPIGKGHRCINPSTYRDLDTLYSLENIDFWKMGDRAKLEMYRAKRIDDRARLEAKIAAEEKACEPKEPYEIIAMPPGTTVEDAIRSCS